MATLLSTSPAPHIRVKDTVPKIMRDVLIALIPAVIFAVYAFGWNALWLCVIGALSAELIEYGIMRFLRKKKDFRPDGSAAVTGLLLAMNVSASFSWYLLIIGVLVAIGIAKHTYGGIGNNPFNPALIGRVFLVISFPVQMSVWAPLNHAASTLVTSATPLSILKQKGFEEAARQVSLLDMFIGNTQGCLGEVSALALIIGFIFLLWRKRVNPIIPIAYIGTVLLFSFLFFMINPNQFGSPIFHLLGGGLMIGALFMATDMVTSPATMKGAFIYGIGCGIITMLIRLFGALPEGVSFSILIMNACKPLIDKISRPKPFGYVAPEVKKNG
ncbi:MAG: RnfABCDGE type electron transport complex subunit D [Thermotogaceae bacterium]|nr:RnfABCDGE type electron transport complex subunit D [Thermotogaceae bacterium]HNR64133.1 RnfABCDGE type electron transport complex subunit D [Thermotogota bacterium]HOZ12625.1 RnfABCDGE type electron transport complex subunit D [Thermotogota bacterium]HPB87332.1 RnfABCDGE type electron transport complex subunit D [Thermotogota bacterium]HPH10840.1 RnfABCDGE type electron transport complex subunit D [Thermotogota bacterium]